MKKHEQFIKKSTAVLLKLIKRWPLDIQISAASIERILDTYAREFIGHKLPAPERKELAFWFTLYQFEEVIEVAIELKENPFQSKIILPYQALIEKNLAIASRALRINRALPPEFNASRPGDFGDDLGEEDEWGCLLPQYLPQHLSQH